MAHEAEPSELGVDDSWGRPHEHIGTGKIARRNQHYAGPGRGYRSECVVDVAMVDHRDVGEQSADRGGAESEQMGGRKMDGDVEAAREFFVDGPCAIRAGDFEEERVRGHDRDAVGGTGGEGGAEDVAEHRSGQGGAFGRRGHRDG